MFLEVFESQFQSECRSNLHRRPNKLQFKRRDVLNHYQILNYDHFALSMSPPAIIVPEQGLIWCLLITSSRSYLSTGFAALFASHKQRFPSDELVTNSPLSAGYHSTVLMDDVWPTRRGAWLTHFFWWSISPVRLKVSWIYHDPSPAPARRLDNYTNC